MADTTRRQRTGGYFLSGLSLLFIGLKLTKHIDWSWWWVLAPTWIPFALGISLFIIAGFVIVGFSILDIVGLRKKAK